MSFSVRLTSGQVLGDVPDQTIVTSECSVNLIGRGAVNYAQAHAENFVHLMEHFAGPGAPALPVLGQQWYDSDKRQMKVYNGASWVPVGGNGTVVINEGSRLAGFTGVIANLANGNDVTLGLALSEGQIIAVVTNQAIAYGDLPPSVAIEDQTYTFADYFPNGLNPGFNLTAAGSTDWGFWPRIGGGGSGGGVIAVAAQGTNGVSVTGGPVTSSGTFTIALNNTPVAPGNYTNANITVDSTGRIIAASNGSAGGGGSTSIADRATNADHATSADRWTSTRNLNLSGAVTGSVAVDGSADATMTTKLASTGVVAGTYANANITIGADGRITSATSNPGGGGGTVDYATRAGTADSATTATNAQNAVNAQNAATANSATTATTATNAQNATRANSAVRADTAGRADTAATADGLSANAAITDINTIAVSLTQATSITGTATLQMNSDWVTVASLNIATVSGATTRLINAGPTIPSQPNLTGVILTTRTLINYGNTLKGTVIAETSGPADNGTPALAPDAVLGFDTGDTAGQNVTVLLQCKLKSGSTWTAGSNYTVNGFIKYCSFNR